MVYIMVIYFFFVLITRMIYFSYTHTHLFKDSKGRNFESDILFEVKYKIKHPENLYKKVIIN